MPVLTRSALEASSLADLHELAAELGIDGYRRLRKADLVDRIIAQQSGEEPVSREPAADEGADDAIEATADAGDDDAPERPKRTRGTRGGRGRGGGRGPAARDRGPESDDEDAGAEPADEVERVAEGVVELLGNGSGFVRVSPPDPSEDDVYISAAQVRRCELVSGDRVTGPVRAPRRSERYPSLIRIDTINGASADEVAAGTRFDDLPTTFPTERFAFDAEDPTLKAIEWLTPIGRGSRVTITGSARAGKTEALRRLAGALAAQDGADVSLVLVGVRPEEAGEAKQGPIEPVAALTFAAGPDAQGQAVERAIDTAKRVVSRGGNAIVLIDSLDGLHATAARKSLAAARNIADGGSLTIVATSSQPIGGETTVIALDAALTSTGRFPALDLVASGTLRPELLVGDAGAEAIAQARAAALG